MLVSMIYVERDKEPNATIFFLLCLFISLYRAIFVVLSSCLFARIIELHFREWLGITMVERLKLQQRKRKRKTWWRRFSTPLTIQYVELWRKIMKIILYRDEPNSTIIPTIHTYGIQLYTKYRQKKAMSPDTHTAWLNVQLAPIKCVVYVRIWVLCFLDLFCFIQNLSLSLDSLWPCLLQCYKFYLLYCYNVQFKQQKLDAAHLKWARKRNSACLYGNYE